MGAEDILNLQIDKVNCSNDLQRKKNMKFNEIPFQMKVRFLLTFSKILVAKNVIEAQDFPNILVKP